MIALFSSALLFSCGNEPSSDKPRGSYKDLEAIEEPVDDGKGVGEAKEVKLNDPLNQEMVANGSAIYDMKCAACHKLSATRVVGPGWAGLTEKRKPEWIMNMITNVEIMLDEDPTAQALLEECLTRMPNQNVSQSDARDILEFMYDNDAKQQ
ncbi:MAG: c-type cytochrome [Bacteroidia bacterium]|nr:c-type cytochrome [Bacteroidia bacterium]